MWEDLHSTRRTGNSKNVQFLELSSCKWLPSSSGWQKFRQKKYFFRKKIKKSSRKKVVSLSYHTKRLWAEPIFGVKRKLLFFFCINPQNFSGFCESAKVTLRNLRNPQNPRYFANHANRHSLKCFQFIILRGVWKKNFRFRPQFLCEIKLNFL